MPAAPPLRLTGYSYSTPGAYLLTICTSGRAPSLGRLTRRGVVLSALGKTVDTELRRTPHLRPGVVLDSLVIMPDHVHVVLILEPVASFGCNVSQVVNGFKACVTSIHRRRMGNATARVWQRGFHDHIVRSPEELDRIRRYIVENPVRAWLKCMGGG